MSARWKAGACPAATHFLCFAKKSKQRKATPASSPRKSAGFPPLLGTTGRCGTRLANRRYPSADSSPASLKQSSRTTPVIPALLGDSHGDPGALRRPRKYFRCSRSRKFIAIQFAPDFRRCDNGHVTTLGPHESRRAAEQIREVPARTV